MYIKNVSSPSYKIIFIKIIAIRLDYNLAQYYFYDFLRSIKVPNYIMTKASVSSFVKKKKFCCMLLCSSFIWIVTLKNFYFSSKTDLAMLKLPGWFDMKLSINRSYLFVLNLLTYFNNCPQNTFGIKLSKLIAWDKNG